VTGGGNFVFNRLTVIIDKTGIIRYAKGGSPNYEEIITTLRKLNQQEGRK